MNKKNRAEFGIVFSRMKQLWVKSFGTLGLGGLLACLEVMGRKDPAELGGYLPIYRLATLSMYPRSLTLLQLPYRLLNRKIQNRAKASF